MNNLFNAADTAAILRRLDELKPGATPQWGSLTSSTVLCHLADAIRAALGEKNVNTKRSVFGVPGIAQMTVWVMPWPKGAPTAQEFLPDRGLTPSTEFELDKRMLVDVIGRLTSVPDGASLPPHPVFGRLSRRSWGRLMWRHLDHHLRQFGV